THPIVPDPEVRGVAREVTDRRRTGRSPPRSRSGGAHGVSRCRARRRHGTMAQAMARLILATAEGQQAIELRPINSLGRHPNNSIQLLDKIVSKEHCILEQREGGFVLRDLGSLNGTYVNGERVRGEMPLRHGDEIALGSTRARYDDG